MTEEAKKNDAEKPRLELLPSLSLEEIAKVLGYGAKKPEYGPWNWANGFDWSRLIGATLRHIGAFQRGEDIDEDTGFPHLACAGCEILFLLEHYLRDLGTDDRHVWRDADEEPPITCSDTDCSHVDCANKRINKIRADSKLDCKHEQIAHCGSTATCRACNAPFSYLANSPGVKAEK